MDCDEEIDMLLSHRISHIHPSIQLSVHTYSKSAAGIIALGRYHYSSSDSTSATSS